MRRTLFAAAAMLLAAGSAFADREARHSFTTSAAARGVRRIVIDLPAGSITVRNGAPAAIAVTGEVRRRFDGRSRHEDTQRIVDDTSVEIAVNGDRAIVRRRFGRAADTFRGRNWHSAVEVRIDVPPGVALDFETRYGEIDVEGSFGSIDADLRAGEVHVRTPRANVHALTASVMIGEVHTYFGDRYVENEGLFPRTARWVNEKGRADVDVHTTFGEVHVTLTP